MNSNEITIYENDFKSQPLYDYKFITNKADTENYLKIPEWLQKWIFELDKLN